LFNPFQIVFLNLFTFAINYKILLFFDPYYLKHLCIDVATLYQKQGRIKARTKKVEVKNEQPEKVYDDDLINEAVECHKELTTTHRQYFVDRGLSDEIIDKYLLGEAEIDGLFNLNNE